MKPPFYAVDLFCGCGGLTEGLKRAGFTVIAGIENDEDMTHFYALNHPKTKVYQQDIRTLDPQVIQNEFPKKTAPLHLLAACPPCQGFSSLRRLNRHQSKYDRRNSLISEVVRFAEALKPRCIMLENVPGVQNYYLYKDCIKKLRRLGYTLTSGVLNVSDYEVPQSRRRLIVLGSLSGTVQLALKSPHRKTVRDQIGHLPRPTQSRDPLHRIKMRHTPSVSERIRLTPRNGGNRSDLPSRFALRCHTAKRAGFDDVYGRLRWDSQSVTITGGCLNPSKGRFLHPRQNRVISPREAALLQTFRNGYVLTDPKRKVKKDKLGLMIGNALPPRFCQLQSRSVFRFLQESSVAKMKRKKARRLRGSAH
ncbi:MAG: (cytosine-5)-methyltransferase 1 [Verrucomicrobiota bacterium]|jgi:DNA (cytosine-5)-methyltransferase 1